MWVKGKNGGYIIIFKVCGGVLDFEGIFLVMVLGYKMVGLSYKVSGCSNIVLSC